MAKFERVLENVNHTHLVNHIKNSFVNPAMPGGVIVWNVQEKSVNNVDIFLAWRIYVSSSASKHIVVISYNGTSTIYICNVNTYLSKGMITAKESDLEKYAENLLMNFNPSENCENTHIPKYYVNLTSDTDKVDAVQDFSCRHSHLTEYLNNSVRTGPVPVPTGEEIDHYVNGVYFSARFFAVDVNRENMDVAVISHNGQSQATFLNRFQPAPKRAKPDNFYYTYNKAMAILKSYNPDAAGDKNNFNSK